MKTLFSGLLCLLLTTRLAAQADQDAAPTNTSPTSPVESKPKVFPEKRAIVTVAVYGDTTGDTTRRDSMVRHYLLRNLRTDVAVRLETPTAFPMAGPGAAAVPQFSSEGRPLAQLEIAPGRQRLIRVAAALPRPGTYAGVAELPYRYVAGDTTYTGLLTLSLRARRDDRKVVKTYPFFRMERIGIVLHDGCGPVRVRVVVRDTSGRGGQMRVPLVTFNQSRGDTNVQAHTASYQLYLRTDKGEVAPGQTLDFAPYEAKHFEVAFQSLPVAEVYAGRVTLQGETFREASEPFTIRVRHTMGVAVLVISLGLLLAWLAKFVNEQGRPSLRQRLHLLRVQEQLEQAPLWDGSLDDQESVTQDAIQALVAHAQQQVADKPMPDADFDSLRGSLHARMALFRQVVALRVALKGADPDDTTFEVVRTTHRDYLRMPGKTADELDAQRRKLLETEETRRAALRKRLQDAHTKLEKILDDNAGFLDGEKLQTLRVGLQQFQKDLPASELPAALAAYAHISLQAGKALCMGLDALLGSALPDAAAWEGDTWQAMAAQCRALLAPGLAGQASDQEVFAAFNAAMAAFTTAMNARLAEAHYTVPAPEPDTNTGRLEAWRNAKALVSKAGDFRTKEFTAYRDGSPRSADSPPSAAMTMTPARAVAVGGLMEEVSLPELARRIRNTSWLLFLTELVYTGIILLLSLILGLQVLYLGDDTWGSWQDLFVAFTWGFGIHAVSRNSDLGKRAFEYVNGKVNGSA